MPGRAAVRHQKVASWPPILRAGRGSRPWSEPRAAYEDLVGLVAILIRDGERGYLRRPRLNRRLIAEGAQAGRAKEVQWTTSILATFLQCPSS